MAGRILVGTSGYVYGHWRGVFYPKGLPPSRWLEHYARSFASIDLNATFYRLPSPETVDRWRDGVPPSFLFVAKGSRYLSRMKRLKDARQGLARFYERAARLRPKLAAVLWQLPSNRKNPDPERLDAFLAGRRKAATPASISTTTAGAARWRTRAICSSCSPGSRRGAGPCRPLNYIV